MIVLLASVSAVASGLVSCSTPAPPSASLPASISQRIDKDALNEDVQIFHSRKNRLKVNGTRVDEDQLIPLLGEIDRKEPIGSIGYYLEEGAEVASSSTIASNVKEFAERGDIKFFENTYGSYFFWQ